jgi:hypothetical protein
MLPLYAKFIGRFKDVLGMDVDEHHIKYKMSNLEDRLDCLFNASVSRKKHWKQVDTGTQAYWNTK